MKEKSVESRFRFISCCVFDRGFLITSSIVSLEGSVVNRGAIGCPQEGPTEVGATLIHLSPPSWGEETRSCCSQTRLSTKRGAPVRQESSTWCSHTRLRHQAGGTREPGNAHFGSQTHLCSTMIPSALVSLWFRLGFAPVSSRFRSGFASVSKAKPHTPTHTDTH